MLTGQVTHSYLGNMCSIVIPLSNAKEKPDTGTPATPPETEANISMLLDRIRNCDVFIDDNDLYFYAYKLHKFHSRRAFDIKELKTLNINFSTVDNCYQLNIPCSPPTANAGGGAAGGVGGSANAIAAKPKTMRKEYIANFLHMTPLAETLQENAPLVQEWKLKRITEQCQLQIDGQDRFYKLTSNFNYGYASKYSGPLQSCELDKVTCRVPEPYRLSPVQRRLERITDEMKRFSREQYKLNFVELQVPPGHQNPQRYKPKIYETSMTQEQAHLLHNLCVYDSEQSPITITRQMQNEIDCGLISIILAICYDVRTTNNEPTCESGWTRSILCPLFCYFEQFDNYKDVLVAFLRRVITYPLYRNFELGRQCVRDAIEVLKGSRNWLLNQMLLTHQQFSTSEPSHDNYNTYYLEDYIRYLSNPATSDEHLRLLARNVKNVLMDVGKRHVELGVSEIETELIRELMQEMRLDAGNDSSHPSGDDMDNDTSGQDDETTTDDDSVITDSFDSMDMRLIENESVYAVDDESSSEQDDEDEDIDDSNSSTTTTSEAEGNSVIEQCSNSNSNSETAASASTK
ncbi:protein SHQ1 homolog [Scaptodrosophila lebanonensis]|uniref:Protein SHQ1 homolog n=1 Tax=Drosophila lebanonensis TaxID=7225 RepID=A0A6J2TF31_DROLE|nr:protein SHQ1 homolog [Scaptodrosophila lebanonensis]